VRGRHKRTLATERGEYERRYACFGDIERDLDKLIYLDVQWRRSVFQLMCFGLQGGDAEKKDGGEIQGSKSEKVVSADCFFLRSL